MTTLPLTYSMNGSPLRAFLLIPSALVWLAFSPQAGAVCQEGCNPTFLNTFLGDDALISNTSGFNNTAIGHQALLNNTTGYDNTASGSDALYHNTTGHGDTATGVGALVSNTTGYENTAVGASALGFNTTGYNNTATGYHALYINTIGSNSTANGFEALVSNTTGANNTANGCGALFSNTAGSRNVAIGANALYTNQIGGDNTATGVNALYYNTGNYNTAHGYQALESNTTGTNNTASGLNALNLNTTGSYNAASGAYALYKNTSGTHNIALGYNAGYSLTTGSNNIDIGNPGLAAEANTIRIGSVRAQTNTYIAGISGVTVPTGVGVLIDNNGHLGTTTSSARFKEAIRPMDEASQVIFSLQPVSFRYKKELDPEATPQFGLVAEEVAKVSPDLIIADEQGKPFTVRYAEINAMVLNEFLKEHRKGQELEGMMERLNSALAEQRQQIGALTALVNEQAAQIQKVSAQLEADKSKANLVANNP